MRRFKRTILLFLALLLAIVCLVALLLIAWEQRAPRNFIMNNPGSIEERTQLIQQLSDEIARLQGSFVNDDGSNYGYDPDLWNPLDYLRIVRAIEQYKIDLGVFPESMQNLYDAELLQPGDLKYDFYRINADAKQWNLYGRRAGKKSICTGN